MFSFSVLDGGSEVLGLCVLEWFVIFCFFLLCRLEADTLRPCCCMEYLFVLRGGNGCWCLPTNLFVIQILADWTGSGGNIFDGFPQCNFPFLFWSEGPHSLCGGRRGRAVSVLEGARVCITYRIGSYVVIECPVFLDLKGICFASFWRFAFSELERTACFVAFF